MAGFIFQKNCQKFFWVLRKCHHFSKCLLSSGGFRLCCCWEKILGSFLKTFANTCLGFYIGMLVVYLLLPKIEKKTLPSTWDFVFKISMFEHYTFLRENWQLIKHKRSHGEFFLLAIFCQILTPKI
jgi:hypothetical protein